MSKNKENSGLATAGMVLGIIAIVGSWIPFLNIVSIILAVLAVIFGLIPLFQKRSVGKAVAGVVLGVISIIIAVTMLNSATEAIDEALQPTQTQTESQSSDAEAETETEAEAQTAAFDGNAAYEAISNGMTKEQVREATGVDPENCIESENEYIGTHETCTYGNIIRDDVTLSITFLNGEVSDKMRMQ